MNRMSIFISLIILFTPIITLLGQSKEFPTSDAKWKFNILGDSGGTFSNSFLALTGDTIINNTTYYIVSNDFSNEGYLRKEEKKIYFIPEDSLQEYLLYDFNLELGDTFINQWSWNNSGTDTIYVSQIDSILTNDGYRKKWHFGPDGGEWIEGIGSTFYLTQPIYGETLGGGYKLLCFAKGDSLIYENPIWVSHPNGSIFEINCDDIIVSTEDHLSETNKNLTISPNPFKDHFYILFPEIPAGTKIQLFSITGKLIKTLEYYDNVFLPNIPSGIYLISFKINSKQHKSLIQKL